MSKYFDGDKLDYIALPDTNAGINITTTAPVIISSGSRYTQILDENSEFQKQTDSTIKYYSECAECKKKDERIKELEQKVQDLQELDNKRAFRLYAVLYQVLEKQDPENVASRIEYMTSENYADICDLYKTAKNLKQHDKELELEIKKLK